MKSLILTKYLGPTNNRGSRIKATSLYTGKSVTCPYSYRLNAFQCHEGAAQMLRGFRVLECVGETKTGYYFLAETI